MTQKFGNLAAGSTIARVTKGLIISHMKDGGMISSSLTGESIPLFMVISEARQPSTYPLQRSMAHIRLRTAIIRMQRNQQEIAPIVLYLIQRGTLRIISSLAHMQPVWTDLAQKSEVIQANARYFTTQLIVRDFYTIKMLGQ